MVRIVAGHDYDRAIAVSRWPLHEMMHAAMDRMKRAAIEEYRNAVLVWAALAPYQKKKSQPPKRPAILGD